MTCNYYVTVSKDTYIETYFAEIIGCDPKYGFKRKFMNVKTHDFVEERAYYIKIYDEGVFEQSIKVFSKETRKLIRRERKWFLYEGNSLHEIDRKDVLDYLNKVRELAG